MSECHERCIHVPLCCLKKTISESLCYFRISLGTCLQIMSSGGGPGSSGGPPRIGPIPVQVITSLPPLLVSCYFNQTADHLRLFQPGCRPLTNTKQVTRTPGGRGNLGQGLGGKDPTCAEDPELPKCSLCSHISITPHTLFSFLGSRSCSTREGIRGGRLTWPPTLTFIFTEIALCLRPMSEIPVRVF